MIQEIADALVQSWRNFATAFVLFVPRLVAATIIFAGGFVDRARRRAAAIQRLLVVAAASIAWRCAPAPARCCAWPTCRPPNC